ncbi:MAG: hypothetical protein AVDCRST_MAG07-2797, partial [uncultured Frankineae bacterium]
VARDLLDERRRLSGVRRGGARLRPAAGQLRRGLGGGRRPQQGSGPAGGDGPRARRTCLGAPAGGRGAGCPRGRPAADGRGGCQRRLARGRGRSRRRGVLRRVRGDPVL